MIWLDMQKAATRYFHASPRNGEGKKKVVNCCRPHHEPSAINHNFTVLIYFYLPCADDINSLCSIRNEQTDERALGKIQPAVSIQ